MFVPGASKEPFKKWKKLSPYKVENENRGPHGVWRSDDGSIPSSQPAVSEKWGNPGDCLSKKQSIDGIDKRKRKERIDARRRVQEKTNRRPIGIEVEGGVIDLTGDLQVGR